MSSEPVHLTAWGVQKTYAEWAKSPQCFVDEQELRHRIKAGIRPEVAITSPLLPAPRDRRIEQRPYEERLTELTNPGPKNKKRHSRYIGVSKRGSMWYAQIRVTPYKVQYLGDFLDEIAAAVAYDVAAAKLGKKMNFPTNRPKNSPRG
jgi:hypothetical protein